MIVVAAACTSVFGLDEPGHVELGAICTGSAGGDPTKCPARAPVCASFDNIVDWCTVGCGTTPPPVGSGALVPPAGGDSICQAIPSSGTPVCNYADVSDTSRVNWYCLVACGEAGSQTLGTCPSGLVCKDNYCQ